MDVQTEVLNIGRIQCTGSDSSPTANSSPRQRLNKILDVLGALPKEINNDEQAKALWLQQIKDVLGALPAREQRSTPEAAISILRARAEALHESLQERNETRVVHMRGRIRSDSLKNRLDEFLDAVNKFRSATTNPATPTQTSPRDTRTNSPRRQVKCPSAQSVFGSYIGEPSSVEQAPATPRIA